MNSQLTLRSRNFRRHNLVLWAVVLFMVTAAFANNIRIEACVGDCCSMQSECCAMQADCCAVQAAACTASTTATPTDSCCCCCGEDEPTTPNDQARGRCAPGCCVAFDFAIDMAPAESSTALDCALQPIWYWTSTALELVALPRTVAPRHRFDRGPPRVDRHASLRRAVQLLI